MDTLDLKLIALLRQNARYAVSDLSLKLKVSRGTVRNRMQKLEDQGIIQGYRVVLREQDEPDHIVAWMSIAIDGNMALQVVASLRGDPCIESVHDTNGRWDLLAEIKASSLTELGQALERIRLIKHIRNTETSIHLKRYF